jgi:hypothetical protein
MLQLRNTVRLLMLRKQQFAAQSLDGLERHLRDPVHLVL